MGVPVQSRRTDGPDTSMNLSSTPLSLNEIRFYFTRAAVGAGTPFGIGEDFAEASRYLAFLSLDPARAAIPALHGLATGQSSPSISLVSAGTDIKIGCRGKSVMSALYAGPAVADRLLIEATSGAERHFRLDETDQPLIIVGAIAATGIDTAPIITSWVPGNGKRVVIKLNGGIATISGINSGTIASPGPACMDIILNGPGPEGPPGNTLTRCITRGRSRAIQHGIDMDASARSEVMAFFRKCLVPTTDQSRNAGAGAGSDDID